MIIELSWEQERRLRFWFLRDLRIQNGVEGITDMEYVCEDVFGELKNDHDLHVSLSLIVEWVAEWVLKPSKREYAPQALDFLHRLATWN